MGSWGLQDKKERGEAQKRMKKILSTLNTLEKVTKFCKKDIIKRLKEV